MSLVNSGKMLAALLPLLLIAPEVCRPAAEEDVILIDDFEQGLSPGWKEKEFSGRTSYRVVEDETGRCLRAESHAAASGLVFPRELKLQEYPVLSWRWKIADTIPGGDARKKSTDDYAARVYVVFPHWFFPKTRTLNYIWANQLPQGTAVPSPYTGNSIMFAARSGRAQRGAWIVERHNVLEDYRRLFGEDPPPVGAIAVMTDTDNTGGTAEAWYDDIKFSSDR